MDDELVLLTSYFNLAGGRRQDEADTFRVEPELASATSPDSTAALYVVTEASTPSHMGARARRRVADVVAWEYGSRTGEAPGSRLKSALRAAHEAVMSEFDGHVAVGVSVMVVERNTVYLGQVAPAQVYVLHEGSLHSIPAEAAGRLPFAEAIGSSAGSSIHIFRDEIGRDDVVALCSSWYQMGTDPEEIRECFAAGSADDIAESLLDLAKAHSAGDATCIVIEAISAGDAAAGLIDSETPTFLEQVDAAVQALAAVGRMLLTELRPDTREPVPGAESDDGASAHPNATETAATPDSSRFGLFRRGSHPAVQRDATTEVPAIGSTARESEDAPGDHEIPWEADDEPPAPRGREPATEEIPMVRPDEIDWERPGADTPPRHTAEPSASGDPTLLPTGEEYVDARRSERVREAERRTHEHDPMPVSELDQVNSRIQNAPDLGDVIPPVQAFPDTSTEPERIYATSKNMQAVNKRPRRFGGLAGRKDSPSGPAVIRPGLGDVDLRRPASHAAPPAVIWLGIAFVFVLALVAGWEYLHRHHAVALPQYASFVRRDIALAKSASSPNQQDLYLAKARKNLKLARQTGVASTTVLALQTKIQTTSDSLHHVTRVYSPQLLSDFGKFPNANPLEVATSPGIVFVLDSGRHSVFSITPNATSNPNLITQQGESISGFTIGAIQHITTDGSTVLAVDDHNVLVRDSAGAKSATSLTEGTPGQQFMALSTSDPDVYVLDPAHNQVWRYPQAVSGFSPAASAYFTPSTPNLSQANSLALDGTDLFILTAGGTVLKYDFQANPQKFGIHLRRPLQKPASLFTEQGLSSLWIADPVNGRIVQLDKSGNFIRSYQTGTGQMDLHTIRSFAVGPAGNTLYVLCAKRLFAFPIAK